jgi:hypothetical protein
MSKIKSMILQRIDAVDQENMSEEIIGDISEDVSNAFEVKCDYFHAGSFDSVGYDCDYYVIVFINEEGELDGVDVQVESY